MLPRLALSLLSFACGLSFWLEPLHAGVEACGDLYLDAGAECELVPPSVECESQCTPLSVEAVCSVELQAECEGQCDASATAECTGTCEAGCVADCQVDPGTFDCSANCTAGCAADCAAACEDSQCEASCQANCSASCDADCQVVPASADCMAVCEASCSGSCEADANLDCQVSCQSSGYADCQAEVQGGCETACQGDEGALFCDGQYVEVGGDLQACVDALRALFDIEVEGYADAECAGNTCSAEAGASASCSVGSQPMTGLLALLFVGLALALGRRR